jgi:hypothetical protein
VAGISLIDAIITVERRLGPRLVHTAWDQDLPAVDPAALATLTQWRGTSPPGACLVPLSPEEPYRPMRAATIRQARQVPTAFWAAVRSLIPVTTTSPEEIRRFAEMFRRALLDGSDLPTVPPLDAVNRRIAAAAVWELMHVLETSSEALLAYLHQYPELLPPWRWFAAYAEQHRCAPVADWTTPPRPFATSGPSGVRTLAPRPLLDVRAQVDLVLARKGEVPPAGGAYRGDASVGDRRRLTVAAAAQPTPTAPEDWRADDLTGLNPADRKALDAFRRSIGGLSAETQKNYFRNVVDLLRSSGGLYGDPMRVYLAWLALPAESRPRVRTAWAAFATAAEAAVNHPNWCVHRLLSADVARRAGIDLAFPWPVPAREHLHALVTALRPRLVHRLRAKNLRFQGDQVVAVENPLRAAVTTTRLEPEVRRHMTEWVRWASSGAANEEWASEHLDWRLAVIHPDYPVSASEGLLRHLRDSG